VDATRAVRRYHRGYHLLTAEAGMVTSISLDPLALKVEHEIALEGGD
jgi:hypothetical protein